MATLTSFSPNTPIKSADVNANFTALNYDTVWKAYTPVWTTSGTAPAIGNGTLTGRWMQVGKIVFFELYWLAGSTTTYGTGNYLFSLPTASRNLVASEDILPIGRGHVTRQGIANMMFDVILRSGFASTFEMWYAIAVAGTSASQNLAATAPYTWGSTDPLNLTGSYEAA